MRFVDWSPHSSADRLSKASAIVNNDVVTMPAPRRQGLDFGASPIDLPESSAFSLASSSGLCTDAALQQSYNAEAQRPSAPHLTDTTHALDSRSPCESPPLWAFKWREFCSAWRERQSASPALFTLISESLQKNLTSGHTFVNNVFNQEKFVELELLKAEVSSYNMQSDRGVCGCPSCRAHCFFHFLCRVPGDSGLISTLLI